MYFHLLARAIERGQDVFDFGRSTPGSGTYNSRSSGAPSRSGTEWQSYLRAGSLGRDAAGQPALPVADPAVAAAAAVAGRRDRAVDRAGHPLTDEGGTWKRTPRAVRSFLVSAGRIRSRG